MRPSWASSVCCFFGDMGFKESGARGQNKVNDSFIYTSLSCLLHAACFLTCTVCFLARRDACTCPAEKCRFRTPTRTQIYGVTIPEIFERRESLNSGPFFSKKHLNERCKSLFSPPIYSNLLSFFVEHTGITTGIQVAYSANRYPG